MISREWSISHLEIHVRGPYVWVLFAFFLLTCPFAIIIFMVIYMFKLRWNGQTTTTCIALGLTKYVFSNKKQRICPATQKKTSNYISLRELCWYILPSLVCRCRAAMAEHITRVIRRDYPDKNAYEVEQMISATSHQQRQRRMYNTFVVSLSVFFYRKIIHR